MRNIEASAWVGNPRLLLIEHKKQSSTGMSHFKLQFHQKNPQADEDEAKSA
jgi:type IV pilus assembly protein PilN